MSVRGRVDQLLRRFQQHHQLATESPLLAQHRRETEELFAAFMGVFACIAWACLGDEQRAERLLRNRHHLGLARFQQECEEARALMDAETLTRYRASARYAVRRLLDSYRSEESGQDAGRTSTSCTRVHEPAADPGRPMSARDPSLPEAAGGMAGHDGVPETC